MFSLTFFSSINCLIIKLIKLNFQLGPWLAVEIPDLVDKGIVKEKSG